MRDTSEGTVKAQTYAIYRKAGVAGRPQLLSLFIEDLMQDALPPSAAQGLAGGLAVGLAVAPLGRLIPGQSADIIAMPTQTSGIAKA